MFEIKSFVPVSFTQYKGAVYSQTARFSGICRKSYHVLLYMFYNIRIITVRVIADNWQESWLADIWLVIMIIKICVLQRYTDIHNCWSFTLNVYLKVIFECDVISLLSEKIRTKCKVNCLKEKIQYSLIHEEEKPIPVMSNFGIKWQFFFGFLECVSKYKFSCLTLLAWEWALDRLP